jgi:hypothetical protein
MQMLSRFTVSESCKKYENVAVPESTVGAQSIARQHTTYIITKKNLNFKNFVWERLRRRNLQGGSLKKSLFSPLQLLNKHISKMTFSFIQI